ncbi:MAG: DUF87 domain-containing protein [Thermodesulfobacteriota bacterium]
MQSDFEIGRVVGVDTAHVTIELNRELKGLTRATYEGAQEIGRINSYLIIPVGARRLVAMVTRVFLTEEAELYADRTMVTLPSARRLVKATLIGTLDGTSYSQGIAAFPVLDNPVHLVTAEDLNVIFDCKTAGETACELHQSGQDPGFCVLLGESPVFEGFPIQINPDSFFGKHAAILGSTGSGKSCTIASILQSILSRPDIKQTHFVILDTNGEYRTAFQRSIGEGRWESIAEFKCLYIPSNPQEARERLVIPYWFMNSEDFVRLFRASAGIQRPVLLDALRLARSPEIPGGDINQAKALLLGELYRIISYAEDDGKVSAEVEDIAKGCAKFLEDGREVLSFVFEDSGAALRQTLVTIANMAQQFVGEPTNRRFSKPLPLNVQQRIRVDLLPFVEKLASVEMTSGFPQISADTPVFFGKTVFKNDYIEKAMRRDEAGGARARDYCATMLMRIYRLLEDRRFEFLFGPVSGEWPKPEHALAAFLFDILGMRTERKVLSPVSKVQQGQLPFYDRQRNKGSMSNVIILDLSLLASEVLENVTALLGRLILEFLQRLGEYGGEEARGSLPVVLVLEEAQNYIREPRFGEEESISRTVFERIAREGRKFGLSLVVASQRPSELSKTVLSQCNSFIVHRLQNPEDLRYFKEIVPGIYDQLLNQLPALAPQTALVLGECVRAPALVKIRGANPIPRSRDPKFYSYWIAEERKRVPVKEVCEIWEGRTQKHA